MLMGSSITYQFEAFFLSFDVQASLDNNLDKLSVNGQETSVADKSERKIKVLGKADSFGGMSYREALINPELTVYTLHPSQYLPCGIGVRAASSVRYDLTWSDIRRWELGASAIVEILKSRWHYNMANMEKIDRLESFLEEHGFDATFYKHNANFPEEMLSSLDEHFYAHKSVLKGTGVLFLYLLRFFIPLTAVYAGIHLSAWNFEFPTRVESITWRTACFIIMGSSFALLAVPSWNKVGSYHTLRKLWRPGVVFNLVSPSLRIVGYGSAGLLLLCYAASRLYLVVESFISLRHVPIGVYAAVPWVQNIPHV